MQIPTVLMFYLAGKSGADTIHREKVRINIPETAEDWTLKKLRDEIE